MCSTDTCNAPLRRLSQFSTHSIRLVLHSHKTRFRCFRVLAGSLLCSMHLVLDVRHTRIELLHFLLQRITLSRHLHQLG